MTAIILIAIIVALIAYFVFLSNEKKKSARSRLGMISYYKKHLIIRIIAAVIFVVVAILGIDIDGLFLPILLLVVGVAGCGMMIIFSIRAGVFLNKFNNMSDYQYANYRASGGEDDNTADFLKILPPCPCCGSENTRFSDNYKTKSRGKTAGGMALGAVLGGNTLPSAISKQLYGQSIKIDKEFKCKDCGYVWRPGMHQTFIEQKETEIPWPQKHLSAPIQKASGQISISAQLQELKELREAGALTAEEYVSEVNKIMSVPDSAEYLPSSNPFQKGNATEVDSEVELKNRAQELKRLLGIGTISQEEFDAEINKLLLS